MIRYAFLNFWRNVRASWRTYFMGACTSAIAFGLCGGFFLAHRNLSLTTRLWASSVPVTVVLEKGLSRSEVDFVTERAARIATSVRLVSPEEGLRRVEAALGADDLLAGFGENPLPPMLELLFQAPPEEPVLAEVRRWPGVEEVDDATQWSERFRALMRIVDRFGTALILMLLAAAVGIAGLSIRLVAASHRAETEIQRLVGASETFIRTPYLLAGATLGASGLALGLGGMGLGFLLLERLPTTAWPIPVHRLVFFTPGELALLLGIGVFVGLSGAWFGLGRRAAS